MSGPDSFPDWNWDDPQECTDRLDSIRADGARCASLQRLAASPPFTRAELRSLGADGIEFAAFKTAHPSGLAADYVAVRSGADTTLPGGIYRLDGKYLFTELDIKAGLPFESGCFDWVFAEHLIEHVPLDTGIEWLSEVHRVLSPGGLARITTPDLRKYADSYLSGGGFFDDHRDRMLEVLAPAPAMPKRPAFMLNQIFSFYGHRWIYDFDELRYALVQAGFDPAGVRECAFRCGARPDVAALDQAVRSDETMYVEAAR